MKPNVWERGRARRALVQALYQWEMSATSASDLLAEFKASGSLDKADVEFFDDVLRGVILRETDLDANFEPLLDRKLKELDKVELAILRLGAYELKCRMDVPYRVVIDQYVELAKTFGAEESHRYINGVLDRLARNLRTVETS